MLAASLLALLVLCQLPVAFSELQSPTFTVNTMDVTPSPTVAKPPLRRLKILVNNPSIGWSHSQYLGAIADALVDAGHEVHMLTYYCNAEVGNYTGSRRVRTLIRHERPLERHNDLLQNSKLVNAFFDGPQNMVMNGIFEDWARIQKNICQELVNNRPLQEYLRAQKYDFATAEPYSPCIFGIFKVVEVKSVALSQAVAFSSQIAYAFGIPSFSSYTFDVWTSFMMDPLKMTFWQRFVNWMEDIVYYFNRNININMEQPIFDKAFGATAPSLATVIRNISLAFINAKDFFAMPRPVSTKIINIGGIVGDENTKDAKLPERFDEIVSAAPKGVVLFSFGTFADTKGMPAELIEAFTTAFSKFPDHAFIWKFVPADNTTITVAPNVHVFDWVPQKAILAHPKTKVFISHCGLNSANEAAKAGMPVLGVPLFGDQAYNSALLDNKGISLNVHVGDIRRRGAVVVEEALRQLLENQRYAEAGRILRKKLALTPFPARERLVRWVEFAAEFPEFNELNMPTTKDLSILVYYSLDVIAVLAAILIISLYVIVQTAKLLFSLLRHVRLSIKPKAKVN